MDIEVNRFKEVVLLARYIRDTYPDMPYSAIVSRRAVRRSGCSRLSSACKLDKTWLQGGGG